MKIIAESPHLWQKIVIHGNECIILFLTCYFLSWTHKSAKNYHRALISPFVAKGGLFWPSIVTSPQLICDVMQTRNTGIVTSYLFIVIARASCRKGHLHSWITAVNIDISPPGIRGLACKKVSYITISNHFSWTSVSHPFPSLNSSLGFAGGKHYQKITIPIVRLVLQNFVLPCCLPYILFYSCLLSSLSSRWVVIAVCDSILVEGTV